MKDRLVFALLIIFIFLSCEKKNKEIVLQSENKINLSENEIIPNEILEQEIDNDNEDKIYDLIMEYEDKVNYSYDSILYIKEIKFGIKNSRNWYVLWTDRDDSTDNELIQTIYLINKNNEIIHKYWFCSAFNPEAINKPDLFEKVAGERYKYIECFVINDFNNDGLDEILFYGPGYAGDENKYFYIENYDILLITPRVLTNFPLCVPFDFNNDFVPIEYCIIDGVSGFKIYTKVENSVSKWFFYTWNEKEKKYLVNKAIKF